MTADNPFPHREDALTEQFGVSRSTLTRFRNKHFEPGIHFDMSAGPVRWSEAALQMAQEALEVKLDPDPVNLKKTAPGKTDEADRMETVDLVVERICPNPTWIMARVDGSLKKVRVKNNRALHIGKKLQCVDCGTHYVHTGRAR